MIYRYITREEKYNIVANTITIRRFGPSGSFKNQKAIFEESRDTM